MTKFTNLKVVVLILVQCVTANFENSSENREFWVVQLKSDHDIDSAIELARENGYKFYTKMAGFPRTFVFEQKYNGLNSKRSETQQNLHNDERVLWADKQIPLTRDKRDIFYESNNLIDPADYYYDYVDNEIQPMSRFNDELWPQQWYLQDTRSPRMGLPKLDLNVLAVYAKGYTGRGVRVAVLDDGLEYMHDDIFPNYDPEISYDCNLNKPDPTPAGFDRSSSHGTRCAGEIAMVANNNKCGVGIAFNARIGGIKLLGGMVYDMIEGLALGFAYDKIDIYSSSWGPTDNGKTLERPGRMALNAMERGIHEGRNGLGSIFVWASGNGGSTGDNCNCDGYASNIYTITIGSASQHGIMPWYGEKCSAMLAVTYSSGAYGDQMITTTDLNNTCTVLHTGTSASAPLAAGIIALGLEANPMLTWRDVQHLIVYTSEYAPLKDNDEWQKNAVGLLYNIRFGFGLMNADGFVTRAIAWRTVPDKIIDQVPQSVGKTNKRVQSNKSLIVNFYYDGSIRFLEHVEIIINLDYTLRGALGFYLTSPGDTRIQMLGPRIKDRSKAGFRNWHLVSVATWSENPYGQWKFEIVDENIVKKFNFGIVYNCTLRLHGTVAQPAYLTNGPRIYNENYVRQV